MTRLKILSYCSAIIATLIFFFGHQTRTTVPYGKGLVIKKEWLVNQPSSLTPREDVRPPDQTFLTYPEWFLVFGPAEQAAFFQHDTSTKFPFMTHVRQIWEGYAAVYAQIRGNFKFNTGYHVMIMVIATSSTVEFGCKAVYETLIGRLTDTRGGKPMTDEDRFNAQFAQDYVDFLANAPWYEFDFKSRLARLWTETSLFGPHPLRKLERKYILTTELAVKTVYGWLIGLGTHTAYERPIFTTATIVDHVPDGIADRLPEVKILKDLPNGAKLIAIPRYAAFSTNACKLASEGVTFKEIAGNTSAILITVLAPRDWAGHSDEFQIIFTQPIPTKPGIERIALATPANLLAKTLQQLLGQKIAIEHIYDF
ncbi:MAG: hypothetical protein C5B50_05110 [Verrucomicrobia bacterium]|nr:MAG: hypothetical protein C5B50_05110 [Verrucomicrobiota bacterium]